MICPVCKHSEWKDNENTEWVQCNNSNWYNITCTDVDPEDYQQIQNEAELRYCIVLVIRSYAAYIA